MPKVSIITINLNNKIGLEKTVQSVIEQNFKDYEYIVIDGGSTDGSKEYIEMYSDKISYWVSEKDKGIYNAMNKGIQNSKGDYLLFLNSGDYLLNRNSIECVSLDNQDADIIYGNLQTEKGIISYPSKLNFTFFFRDSIGHPASFIKSKLFQKFGLYNESFKIVSDWEFFLRVIIKEKATTKYIDQPLTYYNLEGISNDTLNATKQLKERAEVLSSYFPEYYSELLYEYNKMEQELNNFKNSRAVSFLQRIMQNKIYCALMRN